MHRRSLLASEKKASAAVSTSSAIERPSRNSATSKNSAFITRSNNTNSNPNSKQEVNKKQRRAGGKQSETSLSSSSSLSAQNSSKRIQEEESTEKVKLPDYLALIVSGLYYLGHYPVAFFCKIYSWTCFIISLPSLTYAWLKYLTYELPLDFLEKSVRFAKEVPAKVLVWLANNLHGLIEICALYQLGGLLCIALVFWICPLPNMTYPLFSILRLVLGTLYPAYASYKAVRTKDVKEYVKWMMYWIVFAIFTSVETFADIFVAFWFPFYYEVKILLLIWLISPVSRGSLGSSILYRRFVHPSLIAREEEIDRMILRLQEQGYNTVTKLAVKAFNYASNMIMQTAIRAPVLMNEIIEAQRQQQNDLQRSAPSTDTTDSLEPRFVEVMHIDTELNQENLNNTVDNSLVSDQEEPEQMVVKVKKSKKAKKQVKNNSKKRQEMSSDSEQEKDPDFEPMMLDEMEPTTSNGVEDQISTRLRTRNRSKSNK